MNTDGKHEPKVENELTRAIHLLPSLDNSSVETAIEVLEKITGVRSVRFVPAKSRLEVRYSLHDVTIASLIEALQAEGQCISESTRNRIRHGWASFLDENAQDCLRAPARAGCCSSAKTDAPRGSR